jgi:hypothetical protein
MHMVRSEHEAYGCVVPRRLVRVLAISTTAARLRYYT